MHSYVTRFRIKTDKDVIYNPHTHVHTDRQTHFMTTSNKIMHIIDGVELGCL